jgi:Cyclin-dependent kinase inhibitor 3 (CDKN3)
MPNSSPLIGPLIIDVVATVGGGSIGMFQCPGRGGGTRDIHVDIATLDAWGPDVIISLIEAREFAHLGVPNFASIMSRHWTTWYQVPIPDMQPPSPQSLAAWSQAAPVVFAALRGGGRVGLHCAAGLGRTGMIAAKLLVGLGQTPDRAIATVRAARPGTIETRAQEVFVHYGPSLDV